jgi:hypothetical protein
MIKSNPSKYIRREEENSLTHRVTDTHRERGIRKRKENIPTVSLQGWRATDITQQSDPTVYKERHPTYIHTQHSTVV